MPYSFTVTKDPRNVEKKKLQNITKEMLLDEEDERITTFFYVRKTE